MNQFNQAPQNYNAQGNSKTPYYVFGCLGLAFGAVLLSGIGILGYWWWANKTSYNPEYYGKIVPPKSQTMRFITDEAKSLDPHIRPDPVIVHVLFDGLAEYNQTYDLTPSLATKWERNADATGLDFPLAERREMDRRQTDNGK